MILTVETRMVDRLKEGLGEMVAFVGSYGGELDSETFTSIRRLPAVWVTYGGASTIESMNTAKTRFREKHKFITMIAVRSVRSEASARQGGTHRFELGSYELIRAVKYLLVNQTLDGIVHRGLTPRAIRTLHNQVPVTLSDALSVFAIEWEALMDDISLLEDGRFPEITEDSEHRDYWFNEYLRVSRSDPDPEFKRLAGKIENVEETRESVGFVTEIGEK